MRGNQAGRPAGHQTPEEWGKEQGLGRTSSYAALRRGEAPAVTIGGQLWVPPNWRELLAAVAVAEMQQKRDRHAAKLEEMGRARAAPAATEEGAAEHAAAAAAVDPAVLHRRGRRSRVTQRRVRSTSETAKLSPAALYPPT
jgi:hypothetical protein